MTIFKTGGTGLVGTALAGAVAMASAMGFGRFVFTPILPGMMADLPLSSAEAGLIAAGNFVGYLAGAILAAYGWAAGRERLVGLLALLVSSFMLAAMGVTSSVVVFIAIRFVAGIASAFAMIFISSIVLAHAAARGSEHAQATHFGGVGMGIALSSLMVFVTALHGGGDPGLWRTDWLYGAGITILLLLFVWRYLPHAPHIPSGVVREPPLVWRLPLVLVTLSYGVFGFGYVITATFIVTMARMGDAGPTVEFLTWFLTGIAAAISLFVWRPVMLRIGLAGAYITGLLVEAAGVMSTVVLPASMAPMIGGTALGATFVMITAYGLRIGRRLAPESPRRALAFMTASFGVGQIVGPLVAGWVAQATGGFTVATVLAAVALCLCVLLVVPVYRRLAD